MKRKLVLFSLLAAGVLLFSSCSHLYDALTNVLSSGSDSSSTPAAPSSSSPAAPSSSATLPISVPPAASPAVPETPEESVLEPADPLVYAAAGEYAPQYTPTLTLYADGTFHFVANLAEGMGNIYDAYTDNGSSYAMQVTERDFYGFAGDDITSFSFDIMDGSTLIYRGGSIGLTNDGETYSQ